MYRQYKIGLTPTQVKLPHPNLIFICGPQYSGKTTIVYHMLCDLSRYFDINFRKVIYVYRFYQPIYDQLIQKLGGELISFVHLYTEDFFQTQLIEKDTLLIFDDTDREVYSSQAALDWFRGGNHHTGATTILLSQVLFFVKSSQEGRHASTILKQGKTFILTHFSKEKYGIRLLGSQASINPNFLIDAYEKAVETPVCRTAVPPHLLIRFDFSTPKLLRFTGNFVKDATTGTRTEEDIRCRLTWIFISTLETLNELIAPIKSISSTERMEGKEGDLNKELTTLKMSEKRNAKAQVYYLVSDRELIHMQKPKSVNSMVDDQHQQQNEKRKKRSTSNWSRLIEDALPSLLSYPLSVREKMRRLAKYLKKVPNLKLDEDNRILFPENGTGPAIVFGSDILDVLFFMVTPDTPVKGVVVSRPRELASLCKFLIKKANLSKIDALVHSSKRPKELLKSLTILKKKVIYEDGHVH